MAPAAPPEQEATNAARRRPSRPPAPATWAAQEGRIPRRRPRRAPCSMEPLLRGRRPPWEPKRPAADRAGEVRRGPSKAAQAERRDFLQGLRSVAPVAVEQGMGAAQTLPPREADAEPEAGSPCSPPAPAERGRPPTGPAAEGPDDDATAAAPGSPWPVHLRPRAQRVHLNRPRRVVVALVLQEYVELRRRDLGAQHLERVSLRLLRYSEVELEVDEGDVSRQPRPHCANL